MKATIPVKIKGETLWAYLDTGAGRNFIRSEAAKRLNLKLNFTNVTFSCLRAPFRGRYN